MIRGVDVKKYNNGKVRTTVRYTNGRNRTFTENDMQPKTVVMFKFNSTKVETICSEYGTLTRFR